MKRGNDVLIEVMAKQIRSLRKRNAMLKVENKRLRAEIRGRLAINQLFGGHEETP